MVVICIIDWLIVDIGNLLVCSVCFRWFSIVGIFLVVIYSVILVLVCKVCNIVLLMLNWFEIVVILERLLLNIGLLNGGVLYFVLVCSRFIVVLFRLVGLELVNLGICR